MTDTVIVTQSPTSPATPPEPPAESRPADLDLGAFMGQTASDVADLQRRVTVLEARAEDQETSTRVALDIAADAATAAATVAEVTADVAAEVDEITAEVEVIASEPEPEKEPEPDNPPGKTHWLKRPKGEWLGGNN